MMKLYLRCFWMLMLNVSLPPKIMVPFSDIFWRPGLGELVGKVDDSLMNTWSNYSVYELFVKPDTTLQEIHISHQMGSWKVIDKVRLGMGMVVCCREGKQCTPFPGVSLPKKTRRRISRKPKVTC